MSLAWYPHYMGAYAKRTAHLTIIQHGAYRLLLDHYYSTGGPLPANAEQLHRICRAFADAERAAIDFVLQEFFVLREDGWHNDRADEEMSKSAEISEKRSRAAMSRHKQCLDDANAHANAEQMHSNCNANATHTHTHTHTQEQTPTQTPKNTRSKAALSADALVALGVSSQTAQDFIQLRKAKRAPLTQTALDILVAEAGKANMALDAALSECVLRGWQGFKADWLRDKVKPDRLNGKHHGFANNNYSEGVDDYTPDFLR